VDAASIVLLQTGDGTPAAADVREALDDSLEQVSLVSRLVQVSEFPERTEDWRNLAMAQWREAPGTLALFGWICTNGDCAVIAVETSTLTVLVIPALRPTGDEPTISGTGPSENDTAADSSSDEVAGRVAAIIRELVYGSSLTELPRVVQDADGSGRGKKERRPVPYPDRLEVEAPSGSAKGQARRPLVWMEAGYAGAYPYPTPGTVHGVLAGAAFYPRRYLVPVAQLGWMGVRHHETSVGEVATSAFPIALSLRLSFPLGAALLGVGPLFRMDMTMVRIRPEGRDATSKFDLNLVAGGMTTWNIPLPGNRLEAVMGASVAAVFLADSHRIDNSTVLRGPTFEFLWYAGVTWQVSR